MYKSPNKFLQAFNSKFKLSCPSRAELAVQRISSRTDPRPVSKLKKTFTQHLADLSLVLDVKAPQHSSSITVDACSYSAIPIPEVLLMPGLPTGNPEKDEL